MEHSEIIKMYKYDEETGAIFRPNGVGGMKLCGTLDRSGYIKVWVMGRQYFAHRFVWFYVNGVWPESQLDHINGSKIDNRIENLRECTASENQQNRTKPPRHATSRYLGVSWSKARWKWHSQLVVNKVKVLDEYFDSEIAAHERYVEVKREHHPFGQL